MKILIEMDGPLVDVRSRHYEVHCRIMAELGLPRLDPDPFWRLVRRAVEPAAFVTTGRAALAKRYQHRFMELIESDDLLDLDEAQEDAAGALRAIKVLGEPVLLTMRLNRPGAQAVMKRLRLAEYFLVVCGLSMAQTRRADQLTELVGDTRRIVVAASSEPVILAARDADLPVVGITCGPRTPQTLRRAGADVLFPDLDALGIALARNTDDILRAGVLPHAS